MRGHRLLMRYRPGSDVLSGEIHHCMLTPADPVLHQPDADSSYAWVPLLEGGEVLGAFQLVHAAARLATAGPSELPPAVLTLARRLVRRATDRFDRCDTTRAVDQLDLLRAVELHDSFVPLTRLRRPAVPDTAPAEWWLTDAHRTEVADALDDFAERLDTWSAVGTRTDTRSVAAAVREAASTFRSAHWVAAPGTAAAAQNALKSLQPLRRAERKAIEQALSSMASSSSSGQMSAFIRSAVMATTH